MDDITLTLDRLERHLGRAFESRGNDDQITHRIKRIADEAAADVASPVRVHGNVANETAASPHRPTGEPAASWRPDHQLASLSSLERELGALRRDMRTMINSGMREEFGFLRSELNAALSALPRSRDTADLEAGLARISRSIAELSHREDRDTHSIQMELEQVKAAIADLVYAEKEKSGGIPYGTVPDSSAFEALQARLDQVLSSIDHLPDTISIRPLEDRVQQLAHSLEHLALHAQSERPELLALIDERLDEISRAVAASAALARTTGIDAAVLQRIEARISSLASQINELAEDNPAGTVIEHLVALSSRLNDITRRLDVPEQTLERLTHYVALISERLDSVGMPPEADQMLRGIESHLSQLSETFVRNQADALHQSTHLFHDLERKFEDVVARIESSVSGAADSNLLALIEDRFSDLARRIDEVRETEDERALHALETRFENMASKLYSVTGAGTDSRLLRKLESQVSHLSSLLSDPRLDQIERTISETRTSLFDATRQAANEALEKFAASQKAGAMDARLEDELQKLEILTRQSAEKNSKTFEAIHETLLKIVSRLGTLEAEGGGNVAADTFHAVSTLEPATEAGGPLVSGLRSLSTAFSKGHLGNRSSPGDKAQPTFEPALSADATNRPRLSETQGPDINAILRRVAGERNIAAPAPVDAVQDRQSISGKLGIGRILARHRKKALVTIGGAILLAGSFPLASIIMDRAPLPQVASLSDTTNDASVQTVASHDPIQTGTIPAPDKKTSVEERIDNKITSPFSEDTRSVSALNSEAVSFIPAESDLPPDLEPGPLRQAALQGDGLAFFEIANRLIEGRGLPLDPQAAASWYERAAEQGLALAQYRIGNMYEKGTGVERNIAMAKKWYEAAAVQGNVNAMHNLGVLWAMGADGPVNNTQAVRWFMEASDFDVTDSQFNLAILAAKGLGMPKDMTEAYKWFDIVARKGDADAAAKRDEVASSLTPEELSVAEGKAKLWKARPLDPAANTIAVPVEWGEAPLANDTAEFKQAVANIQLILNKIGFDAGTADGIIGDKTRNAIRAFQLEQGLDPTGEIDGNLIRKLLERNETA